MEPNTGVTFSDVAGVDEAKQDFMEIVEFLKRPERFTAVGARIPKGCLLVRRPGGGLRRGARRWPQLRLGPLSMPAPLRCRAQRLTTKPQTPHATPQGRPPRHG
jgi:hypothetical protein